MKLITIILTLLLHFNCSSLYLQPFTVFEIEQDPGFSESTVIIESNNGDLFAFRGEGFAVGQAVAVILDDNNTPDITDDTIIAVI